MTTALPLALMIVSSAFATEAEAAVALEQLLNTHDDAALEEAVDERALAKRAGARSRDRRMVRRALRRGDASLAGQIDADERFTMLHGDEDEATFRALDQRGHVDYLFVDLSPAGEIVDWMWLSDGRDASEHLAPAPRGRATTSDMVFVAPPGPVDLQQLELRVEARDWDAFEASVDQLDEEVGGDPWLDVLRGVAASVKGDTETGEALMERARGADESLVDQAFIPGHGGDPSRW